MPKRLHRPRIRKVKVSQGTLAAQSFARVDYADAYRLRLPDDAPHDIDSVTRAFSSTRLGWIEALMWLRNRLVSIVHLKAEQPDQPSPITLEPGTQAGIFRVYQRAANEILLGEDDRHLDFRVSVLVQQGQRGWYVTISTVVHFNNLLGRAYFVPVRPFHRLIVRSMARAMFRQRLSMTVKMGRPRIKEVPVPQGSVAARAFSRTDYTEAFRMRLPDDAPHDIDSVTRAFCSVRKGWIYALLWLRNLLVSMVHLKPEGEGSRQPITLERGTQAGIFRVYEHSANEILLGEDDRHLDYRVSVLVQQGQRGWYVTVSTVVHFHNLLGRTYFIPESPLHRLVIRAMMRAMFRKQL